MVATVTNPNYQGSANGTLVIEKAPATVTLSNLTQTYDGSPKPVTATTSPAGQSVAITYNGSTAAPAPAGSYAVVATVTSANYQGTASGTLVIEPEVVENFNSWAAEAGLLGLAASIDADVDGDGLPNLMEYALGTSPAQRSNPVQTSVVPDGAATPVERLTLNFRRPLNLTDVTYHVMVTGDLKTWQEVTDITTTLDAGGTSETVTARDSTAATAGRRFMRLEVRRVP